MRKSILSIATSILLSALIITPVSAAVSTATTTINNSAQATIRIEYYDDVDAKTPVKGAEFHMYKVAQFGPFGNYDSIVPDLEVNGDTSAKDIIDDVLRAYEEGFYDAKSYKAVTSAAGTVTTEVDQGLYLIEETKAAEGHKISEPFMAAVPYTTENGWMYKLIVSPKGNPVKSKSPDKNKNSGNPTSKSNAGNVKTGDQSTINYDSAGLLVSVIFTGVLLSAKRKKREED